MTRIVSLSFWEDPGFTEGAFEIPGANFQLPTPSVMPSPPEFGWNPPKDTFFSRIRLEEFFPNLLNMSYMRVEVEFNSLADPEVFFGWIEGVKLLSDDPTSPVTQIDWHVDYWMTYLSDMTFGYGVVLRRDPSLGPIPIQECDYVCKKVDTTYKSPLVSFYNLPIENYPFWVVVNYIKKYGTEDTLSTSQEVITFPVGLRTDYNLMTNPLPGHDPTSGRCLSITELLKGNLDEMLGIPPEQITSVYLSPVVPNNDFVFHSEYPEQLVNVFQPTSDRVWEVETSERSIFYATLTKRENVRSPFSEQVYQLPTPITTTATDEYVITDFDGVPVGVLPYGMTVTEYGVRVLNTTTGGYLQVRFNDLEGTAEGLTFTFPLPVFDINTNSWSTYVYSGQRDYDVAMRRQASIHAFIDGGIATVSSAFTGIGSGGSMGAMGGPAGAVIGAFGGATGSLIGGGISTVLGFAEDIRYDTSVLKTEAKRRSNQLESMLAYGDSFDFFWYGQLPSIIKLSVDEYSKTQFENDQVLNGSHVFEPTQSCQSLVMGTGPLQIANLTVGGNAPVQAKSYARERLRGGVRII